MCVFMCVFMRVFMCHVCVVCLLWSDNAASGPMLQELAPITAAKTESIQQLQQDVEALYKSLRMGQDEVRGLVPRD